MAGMRTSSSGRTRSPRARSGRAAAATLARPSLAMLLLSAGLLLASAFVAIQIQRNSLAHQAAGLQADIVARQADNGRLNAQIAAKQTDDYVVNKARDYGYVLPGETLIGVQQEATTPAAIASAPTASRVQKWIALFFGSR